ncbi:MAG: hypothetical protein ACK5NF_07185 [Bacilli bacterium]
MNLIKCENQELIVEALLIKQNIGKVKIANNDINRILFLIKNNVEKVGMISISCCENSVEIKDFIFKDSIENKLKVESLECLEVFCESMGFETIIFDSKVDDTYYLKNINYKTRGDIFTKNDAVYLKMVKNIKW